MCCPLVLKVAALTLTYSPEAIMPPPAVNATHVPLLKVQGWTWNTLALIDLGTDCTQIQYKLSSFFYVCLINSPLSKRKIKQNESGRRKLAGDSVLCPTKERKCGEAITFRVAVLIVITVPFLSGPGFNYKPSPLLVCGS